MNISNSQVNRLRHFVRAGLRSLFRPEPQTAVEWADANYYLPKESAYQEGRWETLPFQRAIMNAMGSDYIREVNVVKSARVGYSKMLLGVYAYFIEHKQRNTLIWLPTDGDAENFMKTHVEPTIRDIPSLLALAPWYGKKHRDNTLTMKRFTNGRGFWCLGGKAAKNYREKSVDVAGYDELAAFDEDIEQEGSPTFLGDKRIEGSVWPKSIRGSTPKVRGTCQIERAASESPHFMRFHVACPHCGEEQYLKFGDKETPFGLKWTPDDPSSVFYLCEHNACVIRQQELDFTDARYICEKTGIWTRDGILWFSSSGEEIEPPDSVTFHIWTAYSPFTTWVQIVKDWMKTKGDTQSAMDFILGANSQEQRERLTGWIGEIAAYYAAAPVRLGGAKVPHLMPGDSLNLQTAQDTDNGYSVFEQSLLRYIAAGLGVSYEQLSRNYAQMSYSTARASANESWAYFMGRRKFVASRQASQMFLCWLEEAIVRRVVTLPSKARFSFQEARSAWGNCDWIGSGRMAIDGLKEVQEAVMLIEAGLSTYEKECAKRGDDYQEIFAQQVRETMERRAAGLKPPAWAAAAFESGLRQSTEEEKSDSRAA
ncbi:phage portal protein [Escherichia coli]